MVFWRRVAVDENNHNLINITSKQTNANETSTECVQPFSLDADFDYDNVVLSPKYNEAEMAIFMQSMKPTAQEQVRISIYFTDD